MSTPPLPHLAAILVDRHRPRRPAPPTDYWIVVTVWGGFWRRPHVYDSESAARCALSEAETCHRAALLFRLPCDDQGGVP